MADLTYDKLMKPFIAAFYLLLFILTPAYGVTDCNLEVNELLKERKYSFSNIRPDDWAHIELDNGTEFTGRFKYITDKSVIFIDTNFQTQAIKLDHIENMKIEIYFEN